MPAKWSSAAEMSSGWHWPCHYQVELKIDSCFYVLIRCVLTDLESDTTQKTYQYQLWSVRAHESQWQQPTKSRIPTKSFVFASISFNLTVAWWSAGGDVPLLKGPLGRFLGGFLPEAIEAAQAEWSGKISFVLERFLKSMLLLWVFFLFRETACFACLPSTGCNKTCTFCRATVSCLARNLAFIHETIFGDY